MCLALILSMIHYSYHSFVGSEDFAHGLYSRINSQWLSQYTLKCAVLKALQSMLKSILCFV